eukprot:6557734-Prymnesium_polylepis.1
MPFQTKYNERISVQSPMPIYTVRHRQRLKTASWCVTRRDSPQPRKPRWMERQVSCLQTR